MLRRHTDSGWFAGLGLGISLILLMAAGWAQGSLTTITDTVYRADGTPAAGTLLITWPSFTTASSGAIAAGSSSITIGAGGAVSFPLSPNAGSSPASYYTVVYNLIHALAANFANLRQVATTPKLVGPKLAGPGFEVLVAGLMVGLLGGGVGCKSAAYRVHPGAVDGFDSQSYDALLVAQATLQQAKSETASGGLPAEAVAPLNTAIQSYDVAEAAWQAYHATAANAAAKNTLQQALAAMTAAIGGLQSVLSQPTSPKGGKP